MFDRTGRLVNTAGSLRMSQGSELELKEQVQKPVLFSELCIGHSFNLGLSTGFRTPSYLFVYSDKSEEGPQLHGRA